MKYTQAMVAWKPNGEIMVGEWPDKTRWSAGFLVDGASSRKVHDGSDEFRLFHMFKLFHYLVLHENIPLEKAHTAFLAIDEYRQNIERDIPGAEYDEDGQAYA